MNLRKYFNLPSKSQKLLISKDYDSINEKCEVLRNEHNSKEYDKEIVHNNTCPNCGSKKDIVNKIRQVQGHGEINGSFRLGYGSVYGEIDIDTNGVNHCNSCGNEWKKYKKDYHIGDYGDNIDIEFVDQLGNLFDIIQDPQKEFLHRKESIEFFDGYHAETIYKSGEEYFDHLWMSKNNLEALELENLRNYYKSIYDKENKELKKI